MKIQRTFAFLLLLVCLNAVCMSASLQSAPVVEGSGVAGGPVIHKIDPPNWWVSYTPELTLLLTGENLSGARVESPTKDVTPVGAEASANGHYLFVHLQLGSSLAAGTVPLHVITSGGSTTVALPLLARADARGRFE